MDKLIQFQHVSFEYTGDEEGKASVPVLHHVDLAIRQGEFVAVLGHNGSGKSTLAKHINAILRPTDGVVYVEGIDTSDDEMVFEIRQRVGMVFQNPDNQLVATVVEEDVAFGLENLGIAPAEIRRRVDGALHDVGMYDFREHAPHQLPPRPPGRKGWPGAADCTFPSVSERSTLCRHFIRFPSSVPSWKTHISASMTTICCL